jgi:DNA modification methylase
LNRYSIGIEIEEKYCEIAARRCSQEVMELSNV